MSYTLLRFLTEYNLLSEFLDECYVPSNYPDISKLAINSAFAQKDEIDWIFEDEIEDEEDFDVHDEEDEIEDDDVRWINKEEWDFNRGNDTKDEDQV